MAWPLWRDDHELELLTGWGVCIGKLTPHVKQPAVVHLLQAAPISQPSCKGLGIPLPTLTVARTGTSSPQTMAAGQQAQDTCLRQGV